MSDDCKDFISKVNLYSINNTYTIFNNQLLDKEPEKRMGTKNGLEEILQHPWMKELNVK